MTGLAGITAVERTTYRTRFTVVLVDHTQALDAESELVERQDTESSGGVVSGTRGGGGRSPLNDSKLIHGYLWKVSESNMWGVRQTNLQAIMESREGGQAQKG